MWASGDFKKAKRFVQESAKSARGYILNDRPPWEPVDATQVAYILPSAACIPTHAGYREKGYVQCALNTVPVRDALMHQFFVILNGRPCPIRQQAVGGHCIARRRLRCSNAADVTGGYQTENERAPSDCLPDPLARQCNQHRQTMRAVYGREIWEIQETENGSSVDLESPWMTDKMSSQIIEKYKHFIQSQLNHTLGRWHASPPLLYLCPQVGGGASSH